MSTPTSPISDRLSGLSPQKQAYLRRLAAARRDELTPRARADPPVLSFGQERLWFLDSLEPRSVSYTLFYAARLPAVDMPSLEDALNVVVARHEILRTRYVLRDAMPAPVVDDAVRVGIEPADLRSCEDRLQAGRELAGQVARTRFDLAQGPLLRAVAAQLADDDWALLLGFHHIVLDAWSIGVFFAELGEAYAALRGGRPHRLKPLRIQYGDFAVWQRQRLTGARLETLLDFWRETLRDAPSLDLPTDRPRPAIRSDRGAKQQIHIDPAIAGQLRAIARQEHASLFMVLLAAYGVLLHKWSGQDDFVVGTLVEGRTRRELEPLIGFFVNTVLIRLRVDGRATFRALLREVRRGALDAFAHQELPVERLFQELAAHRELDRTPLFQTTFQVQTPSPALRLAEPGGQDAITASAGRSMFDLSVDLMDGPGGLHGRIEFSTELFDPATITRMSGHFCRLLQSVAAGPDERVGHLRMITDAELADLDAANPPAGTAAAGTVTELVDGRAARAPGNPAIRRGTTVVTFGELSHAAGRLAARLTAGGVRQGRVVALLLDRGADLAVAQLAVWQAGGSFLPLDPAHPAERVKTVLGAADPLVVVTTAARAAVVAAAGREPMLIDHDAPAGAVPSAAAAAGRDDLAYLMATSGTSGVPKIVEIEHGSLTNHVVAMAERFDLRPGDRVLQLASPAFDVQLEELWPTLVNGAEAVVPAESGLLGLDELTREITESGVTVLNLPSPLWHEWLLAIESSQLPMPPTLRLVVIGSDRVGPDDLCRWGNLPAPRPLLLQAYGVTEATITSIVHAVPECAGPDEAAVIGRPIRNVAAHVLDPAGRPQPAGVPGELYLGGAGLARGYRGDPISTDAAFGPRPLAGSRRLYRTGDRAARRGDGAIVFLGRADDQIKVRGVRVEPEDLAQHLRSHQGVRDALVVLHADRLVAYIVPADRSPNAADLRDHMLTRVPSALVPSSFVLIQQIPLSASGKVDRAALPEPSLPLRAAQSAPSTRTERTVAAVWRELLDVRTVAVDDNFFDLGGHSLLLVRAHNRLQSVFGGDLGVLDLFRFPTIRALARHIDKEASG